MLPSSAVVYLVCVAMFDKMSFNNICHCEEVICLSCSANNLHILLQYIYSVVLFLYFWITREWCPFQLMLGKVNFLHFPGWECIEAQQRCASLQLFSFNFTGWWWDHEYVVQFSTPLVPHNHLWLFDISRLHLICNPSSLEFFCILTLTFYQCKISSPLITEPPWNCSVGWLGHPQTERSVESSTCQMSLGRDTETHVAPPYAHWGMIFETKMFLYVEFTCNEKCCIVQMCMGEWETKVFLIHLVFTTTRILKSVWKQEM